MQLIKTLLLTISITILTLSGIAQDLFMPPLNAKIIQYVNKNIGKKVDRGECWDLAFRALEFANAKHENTYDFGRKLNKNEEVYAGDIIQFENVKIKMFLQNNVEVKEYIIHDIPHHTAIIYEVLDSLQFKIADQNNGISGKKVAITALNLNLIEKGNFTIYRPEKK